MVDLSTLQPALALGPLDQIADGAARSFVIDFDLAPFDGQPDPEPVVTTSAGEVRHPYVVRLPAEGVLRLSFEFVPGGADLAELSARLDSAQLRMSETWLYRWTRG